MQELMYIGESTTTTYIDRNPHENIFSSYQIVAIDTNGIVVGTSEIRSIYVETWGNWSNWSTTERTATSTRQVEKRTQYRTLEVIGEETRWSEWGAWSKWVESEPNDGKYDRNYVQVETKQGTRTQYTYKYTRWAYYDTNTGTVRYAASECTTNGEWHGFVVSHQLTKLGHGYADVYGEPWYNETIIKSVEEPCTYYRCRTRSSWPEPVYGNPSDWSFTKPQQTSTIKIEQRTVYRYRDKQ